LTYAKWQLRPVDDLDDAGVVENDAGGAPDDPAGFKRCEEANVEAWSLLKITKGPDGICVDLDQGSFPDAAVQTGGCYPPLGGVLAVAKQVTLKNPSGTYRANSKLELSIKGPGTASGTWKTDVSGSTQCTITASVDAVPQR
jgi:hypothetical protein